MLHFTTISLIPQDDSCFHMLFLQTFSACFQLICCHSINIQYLAPFLFITILDYVLRETFFDNTDGLTITPRRTSRYPAVQIGALVYADNIAITCDTIDQAEEVF